MSGGKNSKDDLWFFAVRFLIDDDAFGGDIQIELLLASESKDIRLMQSGFELALGVVEISQNWHRKLYALGYNFNKTSDIFVK